MGGKDRAVALFALGALGVASVAGSGPAAWAGAASAVAAALIPAGPQARRVSALAALIAVAARLIPLWQAAGLLACVGLVLIRRERPAGWVAGSVPLGPTLAAAAVTPGALVGWYVLLQPDLGDVLDTYLSIPAPGWALLLGALAFALVNAAVEEAIWRGVFQVELAPLVGPWAAVAAGALSFGLAHAHGFPRGPLGVAMVSVWGAMLGGLRLRSGGLLAPWLAHVVADVVIAAIVLWIAR
jgi:membrane protease YdiL (CAAX protease family)